MLDREYQFYQDHKNELLAAHYGEWIVIAGETVAGVHATKEEAFRAGSREFGLGNFLMQHVLGDEALMVTLYSQVYA